MSSNKQLVFGAVADDLTGGSELASMLVARGVRTRFTIGTATDSGADFDAHVIALKTRVVSADEAISQVLQAAETLLARGVRQIFFKYCATFDSTADGNIGPCAEALMDRLGARYALFCPAFCETERTVYQGHMFGGPQLLAESPKRNDPLTPMTDSNLVRVLQRQSRRKAGLVNYKAVDSGAAAIRAACETLADQDISLVLVDTLHERHLASIAEASVDMPLLTGNSSIAAHLPPIWLRDGLICATHSGTLPGVMGPGAVLVGSVAEQTLLQLEWFARTYPFITVDLERAFAGDDVVGEAIDFARKAICDNVPFAISTAQPHGSVERLQSRYGRYEAAAKAENLLSRVATTITLELGVRRLVVAGGETSGAVVSALGISEMTVGPYQGPGMARAVTSLPDRLALMLKSGKLGKLDVFQTVLDEMQRDLAYTPASEWPPLKK